MNCLQCGQPATVRRGDVTLCGTCFYKDSCHVDIHSEARRRARLRLEWAIAAIHTLVDQIGRDIDVLSEQESSEERMQ